LGREASIVVVALVVLGVVGEKRDKEATTFEDGLQRAGWLFLDLARIDL
jgi:hypothetical protein